MKAFALAIVVLAAVGCSGSGEPPTPVATTAPSYVETQCPGASSYFVEYKIEGGAVRADITMSTANGGTSQISLLVGPNPISSFCAARGQSLYLSAQNADKTPGRIECAVVLDGREVLRNRSDGLYVIVTCTGTA